MSQSLRQPRVVVLLLGSLGLVSLLVWSVTLLVGPRTAHADEQPAITASELQSVLLRAGLDPEAIASIGVSANTAGQIAAAAAAQAAEDIAVIRGADEAFASADVAYHAALRAAQRDPGAEGLSAAQAALTSATTARDNAIAAITTAGVANLTSEQRTALTTVATNRRFGVGAALAAVNRTEAQWVALRDAAAHERIQTERGLSVDEGAASLLSTARGASAVVAAQAALTTNLPAVRAAWVSGVASVVGG